MVKERLVKAVALGLETLSVQVPMPLSATVLGVKDSVTVGPATGAMTENALPRVVALNVSTGVVRFC